MFERFTDRARERSSSPRRKHEVCTTTTSGRSISSSDSCAIARASGIALDRLGVELDDVRSQVVRVVGEGATWNARPG